MNRYGNLFYIYIYINIPLRKTKTGHITIINLFTSCNGYWYESITPKITGLLQIQKNLNVHCWMNLLSWRNYSRLRFNWTKYIYIYIYIYVCVCVCVCVCVRECLHVCVCALPYDRYASSHKYAFMRWLPYLDRWQPSLITTKNLDW